MHEKLVKYSLIEVFLTFLTIAGNGLFNVMCVDLLLSAVFGISRLISSVNPASRAMFMRALLFPTTRIQLYVSLLRLPAGDIDKTFHLGTVGMKALQRIN